MQLEPGDELFVIDDGSTDNTEQIASRFKDKIRYVKAEHKGAGAARNLGIKLANNPIVAFLDSDDEWLPGKIELQRAFMEARPDLLFCFTNISSVRKDGTHIHFALKTWPDVNETWDKLFYHGQLYSSLCPLPVDITDFFFYVVNLYKELLSANYMTAITLMVRQKEAGAALYFAEDTKTYEDWECFARLARAGKGAYLDCETALNYRHSGARLTDFANFERSEARVTIIERVWGKDEDFLENHGAMYNRILDEERRSRAVGLLMLGRSREARIELSRLFSCPLPLYVLASLPAFLARPMTRLLYVLKKTINS